MQKPTLPKGWNQVTLEQFIELRQLKAEDGMFEHNIDILCVLTDAYPEDYDDLDIADVGEIFKELKWLYTEPSKNYTDRIGKFYLKPMTDLTLGEFIDLEHYFTNDYIHYLPNICALLYRIPEIVEDGAVAKWESTDFKTSSRVHYFLDQPITKMYGMLTEYIKFRDNFITSHKNLMTEQVEDDLEDITDPEERKEAEKEKASQKWGWEQLIWSVCNGDITKYDQVIGMKLVLVFNFLAMRKELEI
jgi:hypothetical protein